MMWPFRRISDTVSPNSRDSETREHDHCIADYLSIVLIKGAKSPCLTVLAVASYCWPIVLIVVTEWHCFSTDMHL